MSPLQALADGKQPNVEQSAGLSAYRQFDRRTLPALEMINGSGSGRLQFYRTRFVKEPGDWRFSPAPPARPSGGMGLVYEAEQLSMGRRVALKILPMASTLQHKALERFRNEVRAAAMLDHPNIVSVYSVGEERGVHYYAMQLIRGQSLAEVIRELSRAGDEVALTEDAISKAVNRSSRYISPDDSQATDEIRANEPNAEALTSETRGRTAGPRHHVFCQ